jgi:hypothetical protein
MYDRHRAPLAVLGSVAQDQVPPHAGPQHAVRDHRAPLEGPKHTAEVLRAAALTAEVLTVEALMVEAHMVEAHTSSCPLHSREVAAVQKGGTV